MTKLVFLFCLVSLLTTQFAIARQDVINNPRHPDQPESVKDMIRVTRIAEFGGEDGPEEALIGGAAGLTTSDDGTVYILDAQSSQVIMFEPGGTFIKRFGGQGEGPGELNRAHGIFTDGSTHIYIQNATGRRTERFLLDGTFVDTHLMADFGLKQAVLAGVMDSSTIVFAEAQTGKYALAIKLVNMSEEWFEESSITYDIQVSEKISEMMRIPPEVTITESNIIVAHPFEYEYRIYDRRGEIVSEMHRNFGELMKPYVGDFRGNPMVRYFTNFLNPDRLDENWWVGRAIWPTNLGDPEHYFSLLSTGNAPRLKSESTFDIFDQHWNLKYSLSRDQFRSAAEGRSVIGYDGNGHIFVSTETGSVVKYSIEVLD